MKIFFFTEDTQTPKIKKLLLKKVINQVLVDECKTLDSINIIFCSDEYLHTVNLTYLNHDYYTDIITFDYKDEQHNSDIFISVDRVKENAVLYNVTFLQELHRIIIHGILHLCGYEDNTKDAKQLMTAKENHYLLFLSY